MTSNASVIDPPAAHPASKTELLPQPTISLDRRPLSTRYREYCSTAPEYSTEEAAELVESMLKVEHQLASPTIYENQEEIELQQLYDHLQLDHSIAVSQYNALDEHDPRLAAFDLIYDDAAEALATFEATYPEIVRTAGEQFVHVDSEDEPENLLENPSDSPAIPDGQPLRPSIGNSSTTETPPPPTPSGKLETVGSETSSDTGSLKTSRRSKHQSRSKHQDLASCV